MIKGLSFGSSIKLGYTLRRDAEVMPHVMAEVAEASKDIAEIGKNKFILSSDGDAGIYTILELRKAWSRKKTTFILESKPDEVKNWIVSFVKSIVKAK